MDRAATASAVLCRQWSRRPWDRSGEPTRPTTYGPVRYCRRGCYERTGRSGGCDGSRKHVDEEAADELVGGERHDLLPLTTFGAVVLPLEGDAVAVERDEAAVGDGNAVGVARQISQHRLGSTERSLCIDDPLGFACRRQICRE